MSHHARNIFFIWDVITRYFFSTIAWRGYKIPRNIEFNIIEDRKVLELFNLRIAWRSIAWKSNALLLFFFVFAPFPNLASRHFLFQASTAQTIAKGRRAIAPLLGNVLWNRCRAIAPEISTLVRVYYMVITTMCDYSCLSFRGARENHSFCEKAR